MRLTSDSPSATADPSMASFTTAITQRADACAEELRTVFIYNKAPEGSNVTQAADILEAIASFTTSVHQLRDALWANTLSGLIKSTVSNVLSTCNEASGPLFKQAARLRPDSAIVVNRVFAEALLNFLDTHTQLFSCYAGIITHNSPKLQDEQLNMPATLHLASRTAHATQQASSAPDIYTVEQQQSQTTTPTTSLPIRERAPSPSPPEDNEPPPYTDETSVRVTISYGTDGPNVCEQPKPSTWDNFFAPFRAIERSMRTKPSPFVPALCEAIVRGDAGNVAAFIAQGANVNSTNEEGQYPLGLAVTHNQPRIARILLGAGASVTKKSKGSMPPLFQAASLGNFGLADLFIEHGARADATDMAGGSYFMDAISAGNVSGVKYLLERGAKATAKDVAGETAVVRAIKKCNMEMVELLLSYNASSSAKDITGQPLMALAAGKGDIAMIKLLLEHGASVNAKDITGQHIVGGAIRKRNTDLARVLLEHGANPNGKDITGASLLATAADQYKNDPEMATLLLRHGANPNSKTVVGTTVFSQAVTSYQLDLARLLLAYGANPNASEVTGQPILITVIESKRMDQGTKLDLVRLMLDHGAQPNKAKDFIFGEKAVVVARKNGNMEIAALLEGYTGNMMDMK